MKTENTYLEVWNKLPPCPSWRKNSFSTSTFWLLIFVLWGRIQMIYNNCMLPRRNKQNGPMTACGQWTSLLIYFICYSKPDKIYDARLHMIWWYPTYLPLISELLHLLHLMTLSVKAVWFVQVLGQCDWSLMQFEYWFPSYTHWWLVEQHKISTETETETITLKIQMCLH